MKSFIINFLKFGLFAIIFYLILVLFFGEIFPSGITKNLNYRIGGSGHLYTRLKEADTVNNVDVLVLGSSKAYRGYDPRIFKESGYRIFNLGSSAQTFIQTELLLKAYLESFNPKLVIFDVYPYLFGLDGVESSLDLISNQKPNSELFRLIIKQKNIKLYNTYIFSYYNYLLNNLDDFDENLIKGDDNYIPGGYVENFTSEVGLKEPRFGKIEIEPIQLQSFYNIIQILKNYKIRTVLIQSPTTIEQDNALINISDFDLIFNENGSYMNFNKILSLNNKYFKDHSHLNQKGVSVFNKTLIARLRKLGILHAD